MSCIAGDHQNDVEIFELTLLFHIYPMKVIENDKVNVTWEGSKIIAKKQMTL